MASPLATGGQFPILAWVSRDRAHQVLIACQDPLLFPSFKSNGNVCLRMEGGSHALIPDIQNSEVWKDRLMSAQQAVLKEHGSQGGLEKAIQAFSFAQPRFDSTAEPMLEYSSIACFGHWQCLVPCRLQMSLPSNTKMNSPKPQTLNLNVSHNFR